MNEFEMETEVELMGETRPALVSWAYVHGWEYVDKVEVALLIRTDWTPKGEYKPGHVERKTLDVIEILSEHQIASLIDQIRTDRLAQAADAYDDGKMMAAEERWRRMYGRKLAA